LVPELFQKAKFSVPLPRLMMLTILEKCKLHLPQCLPLPPRLTPHMQPQR
jgi:hypothetical protein